MIDLGSGVALGIIAATTLIIIGFFVVFGFYTGVKQVRDRAHITPAENPPEWLQNATDPEEDSEIEQGQDSGGRTGHQSGQDD